MPDFTKALVGFSRRRKGGMPKSSAALSLFNCAAVPRVSQPTVPARFARCSPSPTVWETEPVTMTANQARPRWLLRSFRTPPRVSLLLTGTDELEHFFTTAGALFQFYTFAFNGTASAGNTNVLLSQVDVSNVPLPAALPLFATGLGALGLLGWRRKRKAQAAA